MTRTCDRHRNLATAGGALSRARCRFAVRRWAPGRIRALESAPTDGPGRPPLPRPPAHSISLSPWTKPSQTTSGHGLTFCAAGSPAPTPVMAPQLPLRSSLCAWRTTRCAAPRPGAMTVAVDPVNGAALAHLRHRREGETGAHRPRRAPESRRLHPPEQAALGPTPSPLRLT